MDKLFEELVDKICSTQDLQLALSELQKLLKIHTKIEGVFLGHHAAHSGELYQLAYADSHSSHNLNYTMQPDDILQDYLVSSQRQEVNVLRMLRDFPSMARTLSPHIPDHNSLYELRIRLDDRYIGMLAFHTPEPHLPDNVLNLLMKIRGPIALILANHLRRISVWPKADADICQSIAESESFHVHGRSPSMHGVYRALQLAAPTNNTILLTGETGVGKEVYARYVHSLSSQKDKTFVHVNCGAVAESLIDSEFFGHKKGAFTGAVADHAGFFEQAEGGTIFLDEIGELPLHMQARLLLVLQDKSIRKIGDTRPIPLNVRIIAATNCDIAQMCRNGLFRKDLYYRLNCITVTVPPLRERPGDIPFLAEQLLERAVKENSGLRVPAIPPEEMDKLVQYSWPGNVRELDNCVRRSLIFSGGGALRVDLPCENSLCHTPGAPAHGPSMPPFSPHSGPATDGRPNSLNSTVRRHIEDALKRAGGRVHGPGGAAEILGVNPSTLRSRMEKLDIPFGKKFSYLYI